MRRRRWASYAAGIALAACAGCLSPAKSDLAAPTAVIASPEQGAAQPVDAAATVPPEGASAAGQEPAPSATLVASAAPPVSPNQELPVQGEKGFIVLPALQPRGLDATAPPQSAIRPAGFQEVAPPPRSLPGLPPLDVEPPTKPADETKDKPAGSSTGTSTTDNKDVPIVDAPQPDVSAPKQFANRCKECSFVKKFLTKTIPVKDAPKEMHLAAAPAYVIRPPDILLIESPRSLPDQPIAGEHLVRPDGTVHLGLYGTVRVAGMTVEQAKEAIQKHLATIIREPQVNVDVYAYNSQFYYIVYDGAGFGEAVVKFSFTGNETVLDAIAQIGGIPTVSSKYLLWIARPTHDPKHSLILPVDWENIVKCGQTATNYQLFPGDRLYIQSERLQALDGIIAKIVSPIERVLGVTLLAAFNVQRYQNLGRNPGQNQFTPTLTVSGQ